MIYSWQSGVKQAGRSDYYPWTEIPPLATPAAPGFWSSCGKLHKRILCSLTVLHHAVRIKEETGVFNTSSYHMYVLRSALELRSDSTGCTVRLVQNSIRLNHLFIYLFIYWKWSYLKHSLQAIQNVSYTGKITEEGTRCKILLDTMKIIILWDVMPCSLVEVYLWFEGAYNFHL
jgi:hypothetical protein